MAYTGPTATHLQAQSSVIPSNGMASQLPAVNPLVTHQQTMHQQPLCQAVSTQPAYHYKQNPSSFYQSVNTAPQHHLQSASRPTPFVTSGSVGRIIPAEQPYAFTTVTYAKQPVQPNHEEFKKAYVRQTVDHEHERALRIVKRQKGACSGCNECFCGCCDTNGGFCACLNCARCCDREERVPVSIEAVPRGKKSC